MVEIEEIVVVATGDKTKKDKYYKNITIILSFCYRNLILLFFCVYCCTISLMDNILSNQGGEYIWQSIQCKEKQTIRFF